MEAKSRAVKKEKPGEGQKENERGKRGTELTGATVSDGSAGRVRARQWGQGCHCPIAWLKPDTGAQLPESVTVVRFILMMILMLYLL